MHMTRSTQIGCAAALVLAFGAGTLGAQTAPGEQAPQQAPAVASQPAVVASQPQAAVPRPAPAPAIPTGVATPPGYVIGPEDVLSILYWKDKDMTTDVAVRPDGMISLSLLNDIVAAGLTPDQLRVKLVEESRKYIEDPNITVVVKAIN